MTISSYTQRVIDPGALYVINWLYDTIAEEDLEEFGAQLKCWTWSEFKREFLETLAEIGRVTGEEFIPSEWDIGDEAWKQAYDELHYDFS